MNKESNSKKAPSYAKLTKAVIKSDKFLKSWQELGDAGIGSSVAANTVRDLIAKSDWQKERLKGTIHEIARAAADWAETPMTDENLEKFLQVITGHVLAVAACEVIIGAMVGIGMAVDVEEETA